MYKILICDDEKDIVSALKIYLTAEGYDCYTAYNGIEAIDVIKNLEVHLVLLDIMMPVLDGVSALAEIRQLSNIPVIFLTAKSEDTDKILGLNVGADDYVTKPFNPVELIARVKSALRRYFSLGGSVVRSTDCKIGGIILDDDAKKVTVDGENISLTPREYEILRFLMQNKGKVFSPKEIYKNVWKEQPLGAENTVAVHIRHIREKIEIDSQNPRYLKVVWGQGYKMEEGM